MSSRQRFEIPVRVQIDILVQVADLPTDQLTREELRILATEAEGAALEFLAKELRRRIPEPHMVGGGSAKARLHDAAWGVSAKKADVTFTMPGWKHRFHGREYDDV